MDIEIEESLVEVLSLNKLLGLLVKPYNCLLVEITVFLLYSYI